MYLVFASFGCVFGRHPVSDLRQANSILSNIIYLLRRVLSHLDLLRRAVLRRLIMLAQQILAEIAVEIAPDRVYVIGVVLRVVVFDQKRRALHPVVMRIAFVDAARPAEIYLVEAGLPHLLRPPALAIPSVRLRGLRPGSSRRPAECLKAFRP